MREPGLGRKIMSDDRQWFSAPVTLKDHVEIAMMRDMYFSDTPYKQDGYFVQLGPGNKWINEYVNLDFPEWDGDKMALPFKDGEIDGIVSYHTLDHLERPIAVLAEIQRVLKDGGWFVNIVPHYASELWHADLTHKSQFATETWRSIFSTRHYDHAAVKGHVDWKLRIEFNMIMGFTERNTVLVTKLVKDEWANENG
jgi:SAM-dependent methyltransferase